MPNYVENNSLISVKNIIIQAVYPVFVVEKKAKTPPVMSQKSIKEFKKTGTDSTKKVNPGDIAGSIFAVDGGINIIADLLNDRISNNEAAKRLFDLGVYRANSDPDDPEPLTKQNIQYHKDKVKKRLGIEKRDKNVYFVPFITTETATTYLKKAQTELNLYDKDHPSNKNFKIDPILGLHMMAMELESFAETVQLDFKETLQLKKLKMLIYEKLNKIDDSQERDINKKQLIKKLDDLSKFQADYHIEVEDAFVEFATKAKILYKSGDNLPQFEQLLLDFEKIINVKDKYLDYIEQINLSGEEIETAFKPVEEYFESFDLDLSEELEI